MFVEWMHEGILRGISKGFLNESFVKISKVIFRGTLKKTAKGIVEETPVWIIARCLKEIPDY